MKILKPVMALQNLKIRDKLLVTCSMILIVSNVLIGIPVTYIATQIIASKSSYYLMNSLEQISKNIDINLEQINIASYSFLSNTGILNVLRSSSNATSISTENSRYIQNILLSTLFSRSDIESIYLFDNNGHYWSTRDDEIKTGLDYDKIRIEASKGEGRMVWMNTQKVINYEIPVVRDIYDISTMKHIGVLLIFIRENSLRDIYLKGNLKIKSFSYIVNEDGYIVSCYDSKEIGKKFEDGLIEKMNSNSGHFSFGQKEKSLVVYQTSSLTNWRYVYIVPDEELYGEIGYLKNWMLLIMGVFTVVAFLIIILLSNSISNPIKNISKTMKDANIDSLRVNVEYKGKDEIGLLVNTINSMMKRIQGLIKEVYHQKIYKQEQEIKTLQAQINPHFLYNTLETVNWMGSKSNNPQICEVVILLADIMKYSINRNNDIVELKDEIENVKKYLSIQQIRYRERLNVFFDIPEKLLKIKLPKLLIQPIVENSIMHGVEKKVGNGRIRILGKINEESIQIIVEDNGAGMDEEMLNDLLNRLKAEESISEGTSIGMINVNSRIKLHYGKEYGIHIKSIKNVGTQVCLNLPNLLGEGDI